MAEQIKFISLDVWGTNEQWIYDYITQKDAESIKTVSLSPDGKKMRFYKITTPTSDSTPAYEIEIPDQADLTSYMQKVTGATANNIPILTTGGSIKDSGIGVNDVATKEEVTERINTAISQSGRIQKEVVQELPTGANIKENVFYLLKIASATGKDKYEIWTKIGSELILIDDTSVDMTGYATLSDLSSAIAEGVTDAVSQATTAAAADATQKSNKALADAKQYTDTQLSPVKTRVTNLETTVGGHTTSITNVTSTVTNHGDRLTALEGKPAVNMQAATVDEALAVFNSIFNKKS